MITSLTNIGTKCRVIPRLVSSIKGLYPGKTRFYSSDKRAIPSVVLDELKNGSRLAALDEDKSSVDQEKILILEPTITEDKHIQRLVDLHGDSGDKRPNVRWLRNIFQDELEMSTMPLANDGIQGTINALRPSELKISVNRFEKLKQTLTKSFTKKQLTRFITSAYQDPNFSRTKRGISKATKDKLSRIIIEDVWGISKTDKLSTLDDLLVSKSIELSKPLLFLLFLQNGFIIQYLSRVGVKVSFDSHANKIVLKGTEHQVGNAEIILNAILQKSRRQTMNLSSIKQLFMQKYHKFSLSEVGRKSEVYFDLLEGDTYELVALHDNQIKRSKRLLLWRLNFHRHLSEKLFLPENMEDVELLPYTDDDSFSWNNRGKNFFALKALNGGTSVSLETMLEKYSDKNLLRHNLNYESSIERVKSLPFSAASEQEDLEKESWKLLSELGIASNKSSSPSVEEELAPPSQSEPQDGNTSKEVSLSRDISDEKITDIYESLKHFDYRENLEGVANDSLNNPICTVTLGNIVFEGPASENGKIDSIIPTPPPVSTLSEHEFKFNSNVPLANDKLLSLPLFGLDELSSQERNHYLANDPHSYVIQLKFLPSPFLDDGDLKNTSLEERMKYPPVEIWIDLNDHSKADIDTLNIVTVEGENSCYISLPHEKSDLKICYQLSGDILKQQETKVKPEESLNLDLNGILNSTTQKYARFKSQPGLVQFLEKSLLDFSGKKATSIAPYLDLVIGGTLVRYHYINVSYRRQLDLGFGDNSFQSRLVQYNIVEGGALGGRRVEVNLVDQPQDFTVQSLKSLLHDSHQLITQL